MTQKTAAVSVCTEPLVLAGSQGRCGREILLYFRDEASVSLWNCEWTIGGVTTDSRIPKQSEINLLQCYVVHQKAHTHTPSTSTEPGSRV